MAELLGMDCIERDVLRLAVGNLLKAATEEDSKKAFGVANKIVKEASTDGYHGGTGES
jgi:hypothetical protein